MKVKFCLASIAVTLASTALVGVSAATANPIFRPHPNPLPRPEILVPKVVRIDPSTIKAFDHYKDVSLPEDCLPVEGTGLSPTAPGTIIFGYESGSDSKCHYWYVHNARGYARFDGVTNGTIPRGATLERATLVYTLEHNWVNEREPVRDRNREGNVAEMCAGQLFFAQQDLSGLPENSLPDGTPYGRLPAIGNKKGVFSVDITPWVKQWQSGDFPNNGVVLAGARTGDIDPNSDRCLSVISNVFLKVELAR